MGPTLFIIFIDSIGSLFNGDLCHQLYADDLKLYTCIKNDISVFSLQSALDRLEQWCITWQLSVNVSKCQVLHLGKNNMCHINNVVSRACSRVGVLFKGFSSRSPVLLAKAFVTYVRPILEYASNVWNPYLLKHINAIENVQRRFTKRVSSISNLPYPERLAILGLEPLELRRLKSDLVFYYKIFNNMVHLPRVYLPSDLPPTQTRSGGNRLATPSFSSLSINNDFFTRCVACWNSLPSHIVQCSSVVSLEIAYSRLI